MAMNKITVLGFGSSGRRFATLVSQRLPEAELLVYSSQLLAGESFHSTSDLSEVSKFEPTIAIICGVASDRLAMVKALPKEMRGVLIEKPLAVNYEEGIHVTKELVQRGGITQVGYNLRFSPSLREFKRKVDSLSLEECSVFEPKQASICQIGELAEIIEPPPLRAESQVVECCAS